MAYDARFGIEYKKKKSPKRKKSSRKSSKKKTNVPAVRHLAYTVTNPVPGVQTAYWFDLFSHLSLVNRRLYRQGQQLHIKKITISSRNTVNGYATASTAPTSWVTYGAWKAAFRLWMEMRKGHGGAPGSGLPRGVTPATWADFKVYLSDNHRVALPAQLPVPLDMAGNPVSELTSEWIYSKFQSPDKAGATSDEFVSHLLGDNNPPGPVGTFDSVGIIQGYEDSRRTVQQDQTGVDIEQDSWMVNLFDDGDTLDAIAEDLRDDGDLPPYAMELYAGGAVNMSFPIIQQQKLIVQHGAGNATSGGTAPSVTLGNVLAPCGLLRLDLLSDVEGDTFDILIEIQEGSAKGVKALPM